MVLVVPGRPPIDKYVAARRVREDNSQYHIQMVFCDVNQPTPAHMARWQAMCSPGIEPYLIDVGDKKYHQLGSSAAEVEINASETRDSRTLRHLVDLVNNNNKTGDLKNRRHSIAKLVRDAYHVMNGGSDSQEVVFDHGMDVVNAYFFDHSRRAWDTLSAPEHAALKELWDGFNVTEKEILDFTLPLYFKQLFTSGRSAKEIVDKISWWINKAERVAACRATAKEKAYYPAIFDTQGVRAGILRVEDYFEAEEAPNKLFGDKALGLSVLIIRNELGQVHIKSSFRCPGINFDKLFKFLNSMEPGMWYLETRFKAGPMLMNGSRQFTGMASTHFSDDDLIKLVHTLVQL
jgi:hypothetical protein